LGCRFRLLLALCLALSANAFNVVVPTNAVAVGVPSRAASIVMGRGDKRTAKGKRKAKSFGNSRPKNSELRKRKAATASEE